LNEDDIIEILFSQSDEEFEKLSTPSYVKVSGGHTLKIRTTEVVDNYSCEEKDLENTITTRNRYLDDGKYAEATFCCCDSFLGWLLSRIDSSHYGASLVQFPFEFVASFVQDFSATGLFPEFCTSITSRERQPFALKMFSDIEKFAFFGSLPDNPVREIMSTFAIRQMLESWFMRIIGFRGIFPLEGMYIHSWRFQKIIEPNFEKSFHYPPEVEPVSFKSIQRIYQWTQTSIHWAYSTNIWLLWKAFTYCERLFGASIEIETLEEYRKEAIRLCLEKAKFIKSSERSRPVEHLPPQRTIIFRDPDVFITSDGKKINVFDMDEDGNSILERNVVIHGAKKELPSRV
jgi:hypothetical protein